jgi:hypothetical protein
MSLILLTGCLSVVDKTGRFLDGSASSDKRISVYRSSTKNGDSSDIEIREVQNKEGERSIIISLGEYPMIILRGSTPDVSGDFYLTSLDYLGSHYHGWNEYRLDLAGTGTLIFSEDTLTMSIPEGFEGVSISQGRIRSNDTRITGDEALTGLRNRRERILSLCEWIASVEHIGRNLSQKEFKEYCQPVIFPETVSKKKRPVNWQKDNDQYVRAEDIKWNVSYTERVFPEELWSVRNSGTLLRDWEEALPWIYLEYNMESIMELLSSKITLNKIK